MKEITTNSNPAELRQMLDYLGVAAFVIDVISVDEFRLAAINARHGHATGNAVLSGFARIVTP